MDPIVTAVKQQAESWREEAARRRQISRADQVADTLDYCAGELAARLREAQAAVEELTVEQYAKQEGVTPQTVRTWIRHHRLAARETPKGYRIRKGEKLAVPARRTA